MPLFLERWLQFFLPRQCALCGIFVSEGTPAVCRDCLSKIRWLEPPYCSICGTPFHSREVENHPCGACLQKKRFFATARALGYYEGALQEAIHRWKYGGKTSLTPVFGKWLAQGLERFWPSETFDLLVPVPLHIKRLRARGFNQSLLLVQELGRRTGIAFEKRALRKKRHTLPQVDLTGAEREKEVKGAFEIVRREKVEAKSILLVDDVYTTGATANECSKVLRLAGAERVDVLTLAHAVLVS